MRFYGDGHRRPQFLSCCIQHILNKNPVSADGVVDQDMGNGPNELAILQNGAARHE